MTFTFVWQLQSVRTDNISKSTKTEKGVFHVLLETFRNTRVCQGGIFFYSSNIYLMLQVDKAQVCVKKKKQK